MPITTIEAVTNIPVVTYRADLLIPGEHIHVEIHCEKLHTYARVASIIEKMVAQYYPGVKIGEVTGELLVEPKSDIFGHISNSPFIGGW